jgi:addiction module RelE/StbE family toxin
MKIVFHKQFEKQLKNLNKKQKEVLKNRLLKFLEDPYDKQLNNHGLQGKYDNYRSINISGDLRAIFNLSEDGLVATFVLMGKHSQLYK